MSLVAFTLAALVGVPAASAWGTLGHYSVAYIAQDFVNSATKSAIQGILGDTSTSYLANVATWADTYRYTSAGKWSADLHFIDANDSPPSSCSVDYDRDCDGGSCVVSAIANYTNQLLSSSTSTTNRLNALKFLVHFVGDVHQPLHDEALDVGGNSITVEYGSSDTNLHSVWDTYLLQTLAGGSTITTARTYATTETKDIKAGTLSSSSWLSSLNIKDPKAAALAWATEANKYVCTDVLVGGVSAVQNTDLSGTYYTAHKEVVRIQVARAGYRLGALLNLIFTGSAT